IIPPHDGIERTENAMRWHNRLVVVLLLAACSGPADSGRDRTDAAAVADPGPEPPPIKAGVAPPPGPYAPGFDALHYDIALALPDTGQFIRGVTGIRIALEAPERDTLALDLTGLAVDAVRLDGAAAAYRQEDGKLYVTLPADAGPGDTIAVEVAYSGRPDDGLIIGTNVHEQRTIFADNWPNRARFWFPSIDHPSDKATVEFAVSAPEPWAVVANGVRVEAHEGAPEPPPVESAGAPRHTWRWATDVPIPTYTMVIGAAEFTTEKVGDVCLGTTAPARPDAAADGGRPCIEVSWWVFPPDSAHAARVFRRADEMIAFYSDLIAPFPYDKLAHVQSSTRFGGMENVGAIFYSEDALARGRDIESTVAHETAHQWFGDAVTEAEWRDLWLSEGFATYFAALFFERAEGVDRFREMMEANRTRYLESEWTNRPIVPQSTGAAGTTTADTSAASLFDLLNANNYQKGAWVLHMLRGLLGDSAFFDGIRRYYRAHEFGNAHTADLREALEAASGHDLQSFFEQWVFRPGHPRFRTSHTWDAASHTATITIEQVQPVDWPTFHIPLDIELDTPAGPIRRTIEIDERSERFDIRTAAEPSAIRIDPDGRVLKEVMTEN
ncbi:MAG TPA: M1 family metallopeptidase, partial [Longimicrobiales bacterium]